MHVAPLSPHLPATPAKRYKDAFADEEPPRLPSFNEEDVSDKPSHIQDIERFDDEEAPEIDERYRKRLRSMLAVEEMVASLIEELEATGELENTFVIFTSDNGFVEGQHRIVKGKFFPYEESARVPLFVKGPGIAPGSNVEQLILNTDFAPTFADLAGVEFSADGRSLTPHLRGEDPSSLRSAVLLEGFDSEGTYYYVAVRTKTHKYVEYSNGERELYDLQADPYELESLHESADPSVLENLKAKLDALKSCSKEGCQEAEDAP
jgi:arylsulfatase A-like enzyme